MWFNRCIACVLVIAFLWLPLFPALSVDLPVLLILFWTFSSSRELPSLVWPWLMGILIDIAFGTLLGEHALGLVVTAYVVQYLARRLKFMAVWQQAAAAGFFSLMNTGIVLLCEACQGHLLITPSPFAVIITMIAWSLMVYSYWQRKVAFAD